MKIKYAFLFILLSVYWSPYAYSQTSIESPNPINPNVNRMPRQHRIIEKELRIVGNIQNLEPVTGSWNPTRIDEGYVLGILSRVSSRGLVIKTLEGEVRMGVNSTPGGLVDRACFDREMANHRAGGQPVGTDNEVQATISCTRLMNPWQFSNYNINLLGDFQQISGQMVMVFYRTFFYVPIVDTNNYFAKIYIVEPELMKEGQFLEATGLPITRNIHYATGLVEGRIVRASLDGVVRKTYELIVQLGNSGNSFLAISVADRKLFDFALRAMASGRYLKIGYYQLYSPFSIPINLVRGFNTDLRAYRIEVTSDPRQEVERP